MQFTALGGCGEVGANSYHVVVDGTGILLDAGIHPKKYGRDSLPMIDALRQKEIHAVLISHCHIDHLGALPAILKNFATRQIFMTPPSYPISMRMLHNTVTVMERLKEEKGIDDYPLYTREDIDMVTQLFQSMDYDTPFPIPSANGHEPEPEGMFLDAGHILGSAGILIRSREGTLFYTGDTCGQDQTVIKGAVYPEEKIDTLILENTLCSSSQAETKKRGHEINRLASQISKVIDRDGSVLIPTFALGRTQEVLAILNSLRLRGRIPDVPIRISGMGRVFSKIYDRFALHTRRKDPDLLFKNVDTRTLGKKTPLGKNLVKKPCIIVATSGMLSEKTPANRIAQAMVDDPKHGIFFVGYLDEETPGFKLLTGPENSEIRLNGEAEPKQKKCTVLSFSLSAHSHRGRILQLVEDLEPKKVVLVHGEEGSTGWTAEMVRQMKKGIDVIIPEVGRTYDL
ncbi:MAG: MBL fold metallo-hydrolase [bacterium]|nr:MBL fold metallo-hydrolase [bacterium]